MALEKTLTDGQTNITVTDAYIKITRLHVEPEQVVQIYVSCYASQEDASNNKSPFCSMAYSVPYSADGGSDWDTYFKPTVVQSAGEDYISKAYDYLLTVADFSGATII